MLKSIRFDKPTLGVCYYPEHWPESLWEDDLRRMLEHGIEVARVAEFAWSKFEPTEGEFTYDFFDRFLDLAAKVGVKIIFCTPSATPPAWLTTKYEEALNANIDGVKYRHGQRRHYNYNSPKYQELVARLVDKMAAHYCAHPAIIGWQIDNEINCELNWFHSDSDHAAFRVYLKEKYQTLDALNDAMGTVFWNQTYTDWAEIRLSSPSVSNSPNPHLLLEEIKFISRSAIHFCKLQSDIIRKYAPEGQFVTTNGIFGHLDNHEMTDTALDFITFDNYPNFVYAMEPRGTNAVSGTAELLDRAVGLGLMRARAISPNFGIMEQQSGPQGWNTRMQGPAPKPGQMRLWTLQDVAHGADFVSFFRWRTCWVGTEIYWHGLLNYDNQDNRRMQELRRIKSDFEALSEIAGSRYVADVAMVRDYPNEWDGELDKWHGPLRNASELAWYAAAQHIHTPMDLLYMGGDTALEDLLKYKLLVYPHATILTDETAALLDKYVKAGGTLIMGARTGYKDEYGRCPMRPMPGPALDIVGAQVIDFTMIGPRDPQISASWGDETIECALFSDVLRPVNGGEVIATYVGGYYSGEPAMIRKANGQGAAYYFGGGFTEQTATMMLKKLGFDAAFAGDVSLPAEMEIAVREKAGKRYAFLLNYTPAAKTAYVGRPCRDLLSGQTVSFEVKVEPYGVMVLEI